VAFTVGAALARTGGGSAPQTKVILGTHRADVLTGTRHRDRINGRKGADKINGRGGSDVLTGGPGADKIMARDGHQDTIDCGPGNDIAIVDRAENGVYECEHVRVPAPGQKEAR